MNQTTVEMKIEMKTEEMKVEMNPKMVDMEVKNLDHLEEILSTLRISKKILEVERVFG